MLGPGQLSDKVIYYQPQLVSPAETGFQTISAYLQSLFRQGYRVTILNVVNFDELRVKNWGYGILAYAGESQYVWNVELFRSLGNERYYRQLNADSGGWITDRWSEYVTDDTIALNDAAGSYGNNGVDFDFNLVNRSFIDMTGNFSAAKNVPPGYTGDGSLISCNHNQIVTQYDGNRMWYRTANFDRTVWAPWVELTPKVSRYHDPAGNTVFVDSNGVINIHAIGNANLWDRDTVELPITTNLSLSDELLPVNPVRRVVDAITKFNNTERYVSKVRVRLNPDGNFYLEKIFNFPLDRGTETVMADIDEIFLDMVYTKTGG